MKLRHIDFERGMRPEVFARPIETIGGQSTLDNKRSGRDVARSSFFTNSIWRSFAFSCLRRNEVAHLHMLSKQATDSARVQPNTRVFRTLFHSRGWPSHALHTLVRYHSLEATRSTGSTFPVRSASRFFRLVPLFRYFLSALICREYGVSGQFLNRDPLARFVMDKANSKLTFDPEKPIFQFCFKIKCTILINFQCKSTHDSYSFVPRFFRSTNGRAVAVPFVS